jgi:hypothetical protein
MNQSKKQRLAVNTKGFSLRNMGVATASLLIFTCCVGCDNGEIISRSEALPKGEDSAGFLDRVSSMQEVSENDAMRGILMLIDGDDTAESFEQRVQTLQDRGIVAKSWDYVSGRGITRGKYAFMIYQAAKFRGGIILGLTGPSRRYCLRELQFKKVMCNGPMLTQIPGTEYVAVLGRADTFIRTGYVPNRSGEIREERQLETK